MFWALTQDYFVMLVRKKIDTFQYNSLFIEPSTLGFICTMSYAGRAPRSSQKVQQQAAAAQSLRRKSLEDTTEADLD